MPGKTLVAGLAVKAELLGTKIAWFISANIERISEIERPTKNYLYWPKLGAHLSVDSIRNFERFPLISPIPA